MNLIVKATMLTAVLGAAAFSAGCDRDRDRAYAADRDRDVRREGNLPSERNELGRQPASGVHERGELPYPGSDRDHPPSPQAAGALAGAVDRIAEARCAREQRCNNIGADEDYSSKEACLSEIRNGIRDELNASDCPGGVDSSELSECVTEIQNEDCNNPIDKLGRIAACRTSDICKGIPR